MRLKKIWERTTERGIRTRERLDHCETRKSYYCPKSLRDMSNRRRRHTEPMDRILLWADNHKAGGDPSVLNCSQTDAEDDHPILRKGLEVAVHSLKKGKSTGVDNIPAQMVQVDGEDVIIALTAWTQSLVITLSKKGNPQQCHNNRIISHISHQNKVMLKIIQYRLKPQRQASEKEEAPQSRSST